MRVVRMKHKSAVAVVIVLSVLGLLWLIKSKSHDRGTFEGEISLIESLPILPTRSVDFVKIGKERGDKRTNEVVQEIPIEEKSSHSRGRLQFRGKKRPKMPRPPKKRISDGIVERKVVKDVVHGDDQNGALGRNNNQRNKHLNKPKTKDKKAMQAASKPSKKSTSTSSSTSSYTIAVLVISCNRPDAIKRNLDLLLKYRPSPEQFPIIVSQDCGDAMTAQAISNYGNQVKHIKQPDLSNIDVPGKMRHFQGYYKISRHYKWAIGEIFDKMFYDTVLIVEDDLDIAPDFYEYFLATRPLLDKDPTIWCVSAWNDNGKAGMIDEKKNKLLYRSDFFPGLGWMMKRSLWNELKPKWPAGFWDDWMRESAQRNNRVCIRPEISRTKTFGRVGVSQGQFFEQHLKYIVLNDRKVDFAKEDLSYLLQQNYDKTFLTEVVSLPILSIEDILAQNTHGRSFVRITYSTEHVFNFIAQKLGAMKDFKAGVPRTGYHGIVTFIYKGIRVFITPKKLSI